MSCHYHARVDLQAIAEQLGQGYPLRELRQRLSCSRCGARRVVIALLEKSHSTAARHLERWPFEYDQLDDLPCKTRIPVE